MYNLTGVLWKLPHRSGQWPYPVDEEKLAQIMKKLGEEITSVRQVEYAMEQAELEGGNLNLEYYMKLDRSENGYVSKLLEAIRTRYGEKLSIESISEEMGVSASYLSRKFKEITGQTFLDFLNKYRVQQAITLLNTKEYRISEISEAVGFSDYKHFCSVFKKYTLKSPTKFVKGGRRIHQSPCFLSLSLFFFLLFFLFFLSLFSVLSLLSGFSLLVTFLEGTGLV